LDLLKKNNEMTFLHSWSMTTKFKLFPKNLLKCPKHTCSSSNIARKGASFAILHPSTIGVRVCILNIVIHFASIATSNEAVWNIALALHSKLYKRWTLNRKPYKTNNSLTSFVILYQLSYWLPRSLELLVRLATVLEKIS